MSFHTQVDRVVTQKWWKPTITVLLLVLTILSIVVLESRKPPSINTDDIQRVTPRAGADTEVKDAKYKRAAEIINPSGFLNTSAQPKIQSLVGEKVVLIDFWTYSCINCDRDAPYLNAWYDKYKVAGLEIIGIHAPEFEFEKDINKVRKANEEKFQHRYPVSLDNDLATWSSFRNRFWPQKYLIDIDGYVAYDHAGEGSYREVEDMIRKALKERARVLGKKVDIPEGYVDPKRRDVNFGKVRTPEFYFGATRNEGLANGTAMKVGPQQFTLGAPVADRYTLGGSFELTNEFARPTAPGAAVNLRFSSKAVYMVAASDVPAKVQVLLDGQPLTQNRGKDVDLAGFVTISEDRQYDLVELPDYGEHTLELKIDGQPKLFTLTFG